MLHAAGRGAYLGKSLGYAAKIGSRPPKCDTKCTSCGHCEPIQVPTTPQHKGRIKNFPALFYANRGGDDNYYSNYKPMSWKCKCGNLIFNP